LRILVDKILPISLWPNFTPNTLDYYGLKQQCFEALSISKTGYNKLEGGDPAMLPLPYAETVISLVVPPVSQRALRFTKLAGGPSHIIPGLWLATIASAVWL